MSVDELRAGFSRLASLSRPTADPYARLIARRRKRFRLRLTGLAAALLAAAVSAPLVMQAASAPTPPPTVEFTNWTKRLIDSPTRGSLAGDIALIGQLEREFIARRGEDAVPAGRDKTKVLFAHDIGPVRNVLVAHYSETGAYVVHRWADVAAGIDGLMDSGAAMYPTSDPFFVTFIGTDGVGLTAFGLAPAGCTITTPDGHASNGDYVVRVAVAEAEVWRVSCEGREMQARTVGTSTMFVLKPDPLAAYKRFTGHDGAVRWNRNGITVIGPWSGAGPAIVLLGDDVEDGVVALEPRGNQPKPSRTVDGPSQALIGTGTAFASSDLVAVRVPTRDGGGAALSDQLLVLGPKGSRVEAIAANGDVLATEQLIDGIGYLILEVGAATRLRIGSLTVTFHEPAAGARIFEQPLFSRWG